MEDFNNSIINNFIKPQDQAEKSEIIKVIGVGGAGGNAVNNMFRMHVEGVNYVVCNTDTQALDASPVSRKIQLGPTVCAGLGAGNKPERGREAAKESAPDIEAVLRDNTRMVFVCAGMGGGTGTGAAPVIAKMAKDMGILTIGIVTIPFESEGRPRLLQAIEGVHLMNECVDSLLVINSERLIDKFGDMPVKQSLAEADKVLATAAKGIAEIISSSMIVNVDFADVCTAMKDSGCAVMGTGEGHGPNRAIEAAELALESPLLNNNNIKGSTYVLVNIMSSSEKPVTQREQGAIIKYFFDHAGGTKNTRNSVLWGLGEDPSITDDAIIVTVVATGFATDCFNSPQTQEDGDICIGFNDNESKENDDNAEDEAAVVLEMPVDDKKAKFNKIVNDLYSKDKAAASAQRKTYSTRELRDATGIAFEHLNEETIINIEDVPAYQRRTNK